MSVCMYGERERERERGEREGGRSRETIKRNTQMYLKRHFI